MNTSPEKVLTLLASTVANPLPINRNSFKSTFCFLAVCEYSLGVNNLIQIAFLYITDQGVCEIIHDSEIKMQIQNIIKYQI